MSYLVLARKYRPASFSEVVGQEHVTRTLANAFSQGRVHHAFLFCGPRGVGKTTAARILGKALCCEHGPTAEPCGRCSACETIATGTAVDYFEMDGASNRGIDAIRELTEAVRYQPAVLRKKVYVIDEVHMLTTEAFNALLKTLEEPPPHVTFVLATTEPHKVPNTILSRCQRYDFKLVPAARLIRHLQGIFEAEGLAAEPDAVALIARESGGSVRDALSLADQVISYVGDAGLTEATVAEVLGVADRALTRTLVAGLAAGDAKAALEAVEIASSRGVDEVQLARAIIRYLRDLAVLQAAPGASGLVDGSEDEVASLAAEAERLEAGRVKQMFDRMVRACDDLGLTHEPRLVLDLALIEVAALEPVVPVGDLLERLGALERRLAGRVPAGGAGGPRGGTARGDRSAATRRNGRGTGASASASRYEGAGDRAGAGDSGSAAAASPPAAGAASPPSAGAASPPAAGAASPPAPAARPAAPPSAGAAAAPTQAASPAAPPPNPIAEWEQVIAALEQARRLTLVSVYQQAKLIAWTDRGIEVGFPPGDFNLGLATDRDNLAAIEQFLAKRYGRAIGMTVRSLEVADAAGTEARSLVELEGERIRNDRAQRESEAREHPLTKLVLDTFGASIKEIKPLGS